MLGKSVLVATATVMATVTIPVTATTITAVTVGLQKNSLLIFPPPRLSSHPLSSPEALSDLWCGQEGDVEGPLKFVALHTDFSDTIDETGTPLVHLSQKYRMFQMYELTGTIKHTAVFVYLKFMDS